MTGTRPIEARLTAALFRSASVERFLLVLGGSSERTEEAGGAASRSGFDGVPSFLEGALGHLERGENLDEESSGGVGELLRTFHARQRVDDDLVVGRRSAS